jgi:electron transfer flavoprotein alpha subunit
MSTSWIVTSTPAIAALVQAGRTLAEQVKVIAVDCDATAIKGVEAITAVAAAAPDIPVEALAGSVAEAIDAGPGDVVLVPDRAADRVLAGAIAARYNAPVLTGVTALQPHGVCIRRFGGIAEQTITPDQLLVLVMDAGEQTTGAPAPVEQIVAQDHAARVSSRQPAGGDRADIAHAARVVAGGRGFKAAGDLQLAEQLARAIGAELACTRPLAEGLGWLEPDAYVGVSGLHLHPDLYVAVGISGQLQHMYGCQEAHRIVAINSDERAPIFAQADYGIVGDLYEVLPALTDAVRRAGVEGA